MTPRCIINGCDLIEGHRWVHGDLHQLGDCYIFNAVCLDGKPAWREDTPRNRSCQIITNYFFERRGVFVIHKSAAFFNDVAEGYLK